MVEGVGYVREVYGGVFLLTPARKHQEILCLSLYLQDYNGKMAGSHYGQTACTTSTTQLLGSVIHYLMVLHKQTLHILSQISRPLWGYLYQYSYIYFLKKPVFEELNEYIKGCFLNKSFSQSKRLKWFIKPYNSGGLSHHRKQKKTPKGVFTEQIGLAILAETKLCFEILGDCHIFTPNWAEMKLALGFSPRLRDLACPHSLHHLGLVNRNRYVWAKWVLVGVVSR